ncbi:MAG: AraC family transcriptional regulator, partial [Planctomycetaceae bacterium]|nr:AraC family transcriptional regulator [Planctomycetaceae bacterium]
MSFSAALSKIGNSIDSLGDILELFDYIPNAFFYIKDRDRRFLWMNEMLRRYLGEENVTNCIGKCNADYFSAELAFLYDQEDDAVIESRRPLFNRPWIIPERKRHPKWFISSKIPLIDKNGDAFAFAGIIQNLVREFEIAHQFGEIQIVVNHILAHYHERIAIETLASLVFLSPRQFERRFRKLFHQSPGEFILKVRIDASLRFLMESDLSITQIA